MKQVFVLLLCLSSLVSLNAQNLKQIKQKTADKNFEELFTIDKKTGLKHGDYQKYIGKTILVEEGKYIQGKKDGEWKTYRKGVVFKTEIYNNGTLETEPSKNLITSKYGVGEILNGERIGLWKFYLKDGTLQAKYNYNTKTVSYFNEGLFSKKSEYIFKIDDVWTVGHIDSPPFVPGGAKVFSRFVNKVFSPELIAFVAFTGTTELTFFINEQGEVSNGRVTKSSNPILDQELLKMYETYLAKLNWFSAFVNNKAVGMEYVLEIDINNFKPGLIKVYKHISYSSHPQYAQ